MIKICVDSLQENSVHLFLRRGQGKYGFLLMVIVTYGQLRFLVALIISNHRIENKLKTKIVIDERDRDLLQGHYAGQFKIIVRTRT